ncbi:hypothetical protein SOCE26_083520 [Sorangium cellulosum]|uniref:Uncharacterized protein n=1 Tax=Sorangium cellulosum TaxID=56 RepID=A0A2L0F5M7_SORCE|nr:hypothetical protein [Sorangium cellulosum]AUX46843.1 hypothetical protein SOCE26_083520 [Sorangium cellulosum]
MPSRSARVDRIARALLYEGYLLYPYRPSALKNRYRWTFGGLFPEPYAGARGEASGMQIECPFLGGDETTLSIALRFLQVQQRAAAPVARDPLGEPWQEAVEQQIELPTLRLRELLATPWRQAFSVPAAHDRAALDGEVRVTAAPGPTGAGFKLSVRVANLTALDPADVPDRNCAALWAFHSTHVVMTIAAGAFVSLADTPAELRVLAAACENRGAWPILAGERGAHDTVLASPIVLEDWPEVAPESPGDLFDATEIDEILGLRILTLTDDEKREMCAFDPRARELLERTELLSSDELLRLHGALRRIAPVDAAPAAALTPGARVRIRPRRRADALDVILAGKIATVSSVVEDVDGVWHFVVTIDEDPGRDLGPYAHRFFFRADELEPFDGEETAG